MNLAEFEKQECDRKHRFWYLRRSLRNPLPPKHCTICDREFYPRHPSTKVCSLTCGNELKEQRRIRKARRWNYMSEEQKERKRRKVAIWRSNNKEREAKKQKVWREKNNAINRYEPDRLKICMECGTFFIVEKTNKIFCGDTCRDFRTKRYRLLHPSPHIVRLCKVCGLCFSGRRGMACSDACSRELSIICRQRFKKTEKYRLAHLRNKYRARERASIIAKGLINMGLLKRPKGLSRHHGRRWENDVRRAAVLTGILK